MVSRLLLVIFFFSAFLLNAQMIIDNNPPYDNSNWLVDNVLLGGGITALNHSFQGAVGQIGWFNALNTSLGIDSGIIMCTGDIYSVDPVNMGPILTMPVPAVTDPDLLNVANSVPPLLPAPHTNSFSVSSVNDIAVLEFDFIPSSDSLKFRYVFGSEEYFAWENSSYNDVFGFFLSGPGISGPYANGAINLAIVPNSNPELPITVSSVNSVTPINQQFFVDNTTGIDTIAAADGLTTVLTARALVQCGETYHIRLAIADGTDGVLDSYVWLEAGSFSSPLLDINDDLGIDSTVMDIPCNSSIKLTADGGAGASYQWFDSTGTIIGTDSFIIVGPGTYWVEASSFGCPVMSDTLNVVSQDSPSFDLGLDYIIPCNTTTILSPLVTGGLGATFYTYSWSTGETTQDIIVSEGTYYLEVDDGTGCAYRDTIMITEELSPIASVHGGGFICDDGATVDISFTFNGLLPWDLIYTNGTSIVNLDAINSDNYVFPTSDEGEYEIISAYDKNGCLADTIGSNIEVIVYDLPLPIIEPAISNIYIGEEVELDAGEYEYYEWYMVGDISPIANTQLLTVTDSGRFYVVVIDEYGCSNVSDIAVVSSSPLTEIFIPSVFTPDGQGPIKNELFVIHANNILSFNIEIFNRWGELVFESITIDKSWDGFFDRKLVPEGSYYYQINILGEDRVSSTRVGVISVIY